MSSFAFNQVLKSYYEELEFSLELKKKVEELGEKNAKLENQLKELTMEKPVEIGDRAYAIGTYEGVPNGWGFIAGTSNNFVAPGEDVVKSASEQPPSSDTPPSSECQFCFLVHPKGNCHFEKWMDVLESSSPKKPSPVTKYVRIIQDQWVVVLVPNYCPVIVGKYESESDSYSSIHDYDTLKEIENNPTLHHFKIISHACYWNIKEFSKDIANWLVNRRLANY